MDLAQIDHPLPCPRWLVRALELFARVWFRFELRAIERVPARNVLFVGNHSAIGIADVLTIAPAALTRLGHRRIVGMMHDLFVRAPIIGPIARRLGAVRAHPENGRAALDRGFDVMCYPGGGHDSCRPFTRARSVELGSHRGYVRLALEKRVPIVPIATIGSAYAYLLLPGGETLARWTRARRWARNERLPIPLAVVPCVLLAIAAAFGVLPLAFLALIPLLLLVPNPVRITSAFLESIDVHALTAHIADPAERVEAAHRIVHERLAHAVATMQHSPAGQIADDHARELVDEDLALVRSERLA